MIQRIQTIYLFIGGLLSIALLFSGIFVVSDGTDAAFIGAFGIQEGTLEFEVPFALPILILAILTAALQLYAIFLFKNRKLQRVLTLLSAVLIAVLIGWIGYMYYDLLQLELRINPLSGAVHPVLILFANILALRGINKDEDLVKSVDRLR